METSDRRVETDAMGSTVVELDRWRGAMMEVLLRNQWRTGKKGRECKVALWRPKIQDKFKKKIKKKIKKKKNNSRRKSRKRMKIQEKFKKIIKKDSKIIQEEIKKNSKKPQGGI